MENPRRIRVLPEEVARRIAAGEVIERPGGVVRELLDNSIDAGATRIGVHVESGGIDLIRVSDNGHGMEAEDLVRAILPHATSKITSADDLQQVRTLGFRGEALSSVAAVSRLSIISAPGGSTPHRLRVEAGRAQPPTPDAAAPGTTVEVRDLFYNVPARRQFLKRAASEAGIVKSVFLDKALAHPDVQFSLSSGTSKDLTLLPGTQLERVAAAYPERVEPALLHELICTGDGFRARILAGEPTAPRKDRRNIQVFVNRRRIWEYALVQAIEYAYRDYLHGGLYPTAFLFLELQPELVDFNVHPAKREARFRSLPEIHRRVVSTISEFLHRFDRRAVINGASLPFAAESVSSGQPAQMSGNSSPHALPRSNRDGFRYTDAGPAPIPQRTLHDRAPTGFDTSRVLSIPEASPHGFRYLGQLHNLFLVVELQDRLYLVDQHAAHERIVYDRLRTGGGGQELLFPVRLEVDREEAQTLRQNRSMLARMGIELAETDGAWEITSVPAVGSLEPESVAALLMESLERPSDFERELFASLSCRAAVMDGDALTRETAEAIIAGVIGLENARCPHGRPVWVEWGIEELKRLVGRT